MVNISLNRITLYGNGQNKEVLLNDISLEVKAGEFITLTGPINSGKSRILRIVAGLTEPDSGTVLFNGKSLSEYSPKYENLAMVFRSQALYPHLTVRKNLEFGLKLANIPKSTINTRIAEIEDLLDITSIMDLKPDALPISERQLVALARAFIKHPQVLILDEPITELDSQSKVKIQSIIKRFCINLQATVMYATHNPSEAMTLSNRIVCINKGRILQVGTNYELYNQPANESVAGFIGYPEMNFIEFETIEEGGRRALNLVNANFSIDVPKTLKKYLESYPNAKIGIRAENLKITSEKPNAIPMIVEMQEYAGSQSIIYVSREHQTLAVEVPLSERYELGETVFVELEEGKIHLFAKGKLVI
ncbi:MAG: ABC transporter ATP-binding protein [Fibromonadaceae bacterium]|jgi:ABC-type sugar transport system ATPase subunit|nr:ABC transporter ATP-binding protein [Fibromonadaceae bacterium]